MNLFHGTTHDFNEFDINCVSKDNHVGQGIYLTESIDDAIINYACIGPDLKYRVLNLADEIFENSDEIIDYEIAEELAKKQLVGKSNYLLRCSIVENANLFVLGNNYVELWTIGKDDDSELEYTKIGQALIDTANNNDIDLNDILSDSEVKTKNIHKLLNSSDTEYCGDVFREFVELAGFDGVEYEDAYIFFPHMVNKSTKHYVAYKPQIVVIESKECLI